MASFKHIGTKLKEITKEQAMIEQIEQGGKILSFTSEDMEDSRMEGKPIDEVIKAHKSKKADKVKIKIKKSQRARHEGITEQQAIIICVKYFNQYKPGDEVRVYSLDQADPGKTNHIEKARMFAEKNKGTFRIQIIEV